MADDTDFVALYDELGLDAECSMADFKHAYRRRVAKLHPDLTGNPSDVSRLQRLNRLYTAALDFHHLHGRLPGASHSTAARPQEARVRAPPAPTSIEPADMAGSSRYPRYLLLLVLLVLVVYWSSRQTASTPAFDLQTGSGTSQAKPPEPVTSEFVEIGMGAEQVRKIQGEPFNFHEYRWEYGPSWIQFECRKVVDWYSSPLHPLQVRDADAARKGASAVGKPGRC